MRLIVGGPVDLKEITDFTGSYRKTTTNQDDND